MGLCRRVEMMVCQCHGVCVWLVMVGHCHGRRVEMMMEGRCRVDGVWLVIVGCWSWDGMLWDVWSSRLGRMLVMNVYQSKLAPTNHC